MLWEFLAAQNFSLLTFSIVVDSNRYRVSDLLSERLQPNFLLKISGTVDLEATVMFNN